MAYEHVIWDWNGTLLDDLDLSVRVVNQLLARRSLPLLTVERYHQVFDFPIADYYRRIGFDLEREKFQQLAEEYLDAYDAAWRQCSLRDQAREVVEGLNRVGVGQSVLSATEQSRLDDHVAHFQIGELMQGCVGLDNTLAVSKVERGKQWLAQLDCAPERVVLIGDTSHDLEVARRLGVDCLVMLGGHHTAERLAVPSEMIVDGPQQVPARVI